jgi:putative ABC transport system permease protein
MMGALAVIFRMLQYAYPVEFRRAYGPAMDRDFEDAVRDERQTRGLPAALVFAAGAYADVLVTALKEYAAMLYRDLVFAFRSVRKTPVFAAVVIATLAIAIGANAAVFSILRAVVLAPLPYPHADRLVALQGTRSGDDFGLSLPDVRDLRDQTRTLASMAAYTRESLTLTGRGEPKRLIAMTATQGLFETLGAAPQLGRFFGSVDQGPGAAPVVVLSDRLWRSVLHAEPGIIGQSLLLDGVAYRIVGVAPAAFAQPSFGHDFTPADVWRLLPFRAVVRDEYNRGAHYFSAVGRLRDNTTIDAARADLDTLFARLVRRYPETDKHFGVRVEPLVDEIVGNVRPVLFAVFAAVAGVLLVACANVANLLLSRAASRDRELAVRAAIGATRGRLISQLLTETFAFAVVGGALGIGLAILALRGFVALHPSGIPRIDDVRFDVRSALYTLGVVAFCTIAAGLTPAFSLSRRDLVKSLKAAGRSGDASSGRQVRNALVIAEIALTLALVVAAGLVVRSFITLTAQPLGFRAANLTAIGSVDLPDRRYHADAQVVAFHAAALDRVRAIPGIETAAWACCAPFTHHSFNLVFSIVGRPAAAGEQPSALVNLIGPQYFALLRIPMIAGRPFGDRDRAGTQNVVIVNAAFGRRYFPDASPVGMRIHWGGSPPGQPSPTRTIVGVAADVRESYAQPQQPMIYLPDAQVPEGNSLLLVRASVPSAVTAALAALAATDRELPLPVAQPLAAALQQDAAPARLSAIALGALAIVALLLSAAGVFAVVSYSVAQRTHEFGIRMALGARGAAVVRGVVLGAMRSAAIGVVFGLILAGFATRYLGDQLYDTAPLDPLTFGGVTLVIGVASTIAALLPARRATRVDPAVALRYE